jgi:hypothetical protein
MGITSGKVITSKETEEARDDRDHEHRLNLGNTWEENVLVSA